MFNREKNHFFASFDSISIDVNEMSSPSSLVQSLFERAVEGGVSDLHFEPTSTGIQVRFRLDGALKPVCEVPLAIKAEVLSRLKVMANLDIAEKRRPQDGRIRFAHAGRPIDVRVSTLPSEHGEKIVLRILDQASFDLDLERIGIEAPELELFQQVFSMPWGMILITGPTGAGKSTTLYSVLKKIRSPSVNITTVEDPVEYRLEGITQTAVKSEIGLTFAAALRSILRQDPNVIMLGEVRDLETAEIAIRAALTGHLVLSTLHTNDAPSSVARLLDMGVEPFLIASATNLIVAQRLVRKVCLHCSKPDPQSAFLLKSLGAQGKAGNWLRGTGCSHCGNTGFKGRVGIFEFMKISEEIREMIVDRADANKIREVAIGQGMITLREEGLRKAARGITSLSEVLQETST